MGEIADDMIDGACCSICGCYFVDDKTKEKIESNKHKCNVISVYIHGYPVACRDCYTPDCGYQKAEVDTI